MKTITRSLVGLILVVSAGVGVAALLSTPARAVDYPCDPTYQMLKSCKAQHGHWDNTCCCCKTH